MAPNHLLLSALAAFLAIDVAQSVPAASSATTTAAASATTLNPNGPYKNPYDSVPLPFTWPGKPSKGQTAPSSSPGPAYPSGGLPQFASKYVPGIWLPKGEDSLLAALAQDITNGDSLFGVIDHNPLASNIIPAAYQTVVPRPTHTVTAGETPTSGPCATAPDTGVTRTYDFTVSYQTIAPDGVYEILLLQPYSS